MNELGIKFMVIDQWGEVFVNVMGTCNLNNWSRYYLGANATVSIFLGKGLSFDISGLTFQSLTAGRHEGVNEINTRKTLPVLLWSNLKGF